MWKGNDGIEPGRSNDVELLKTNSLYEQHDSENKNDKSWK
jgi:hypothetical protein